MVGLVIFWRKETDCGLKRRTGIASLLLGSGADTLGGWYDFGSN